MLGQVAVEDDGLQKLVLHRSFSRPWRVRSAQRTSQVATVYPSDLKNAALCRPTGCTGESKYSLTLTGSITARAACGIFMRGRTPPGYGNFPRYAAGSAQNFA